MPSPRRPSKAGGDGEKPARDSAGLKEYRAKRDFDATSEPSGRGGEKPKRQPAKRPAAKKASSKKRTASKRTEQAPRFVVHEHSATRLHWDLRLERDGVLASWAVPKGLPQAPKENRLAVWTEDHPLEYVDFHGEIPKGQYGAGTMKIWDHGTYEVLKWEPRKIEVALHGERVDARYALFPISSPPTEGERPKEWMIHRMDPPADAAREPMPEHVKPMLARPGSLPSEDAGWAYEIKWDGVRAIAYSTPGELRLESRNLKEITGSYPELGRLNRALSSHAAILDGEIVAFDEQRRPSFAALQQRMHVGSAAQAKRLAKASPVTYMIFDLLWLDGHSLMELRYEERHELLDALALSGEAWQTPEPPRRARARRAEGDRRAAPRGHRRKAPGLALRARRARIDVDQDQERRAPGARDRRLAARRGAARAAHRRAARRRHTTSTVAFRYAGRVGTGFSDAELDHLGKLLKPLGREDSPFTAGERTPRDAVFVEPKLVAEIEFTEWTSAGVLRHPSYKGLREDKDAREVVREDLPRAGPEAPAQSAQRSKSGRAGPGSERSGSKRSESKRSGSRPAERNPSKDPGDVLEPALVLHGHDGAKAATTTVERHELKLSNLDKPLYPRAGFLKRDVIDYYASIATTIGAHLEGRALTVKRWPDGVDGKAFFQKQAPAHRPDWVQTVTLASEKKPIDYLLAEDRATIVWLANLAALELHVPLARAEAPERPTTLVFDLDPGPPATAIECCRVALTLQGMFENLGLESFVKTSGNQGPADICAAERPRHRLRADQAVCQNRRRVARRGAARADRLAHDQDRAAGQGADRLEPERPQQDDSMRLLAARRRASHHLNAAPMGRAARCARRRRSRRPALRGCPGARADRRARRPVRARAFARAEAAVGLAPSIRAGPPTRARRARSR